MNPLNQDRYSRQILFAPIGQAGQEILLNSSITIVGCGALGSFHAALLARAGVGGIRIIDRDYVENSNLQRQMLFEHADAEAALPKAMAAARAMERINPELKFTTHVTDLNPSNIEELLSGTNLVLDGTDNFETRYLINDYCVRDSIPWIYGAAVGAYGFTMASNYNDRCRPPEVLVEGDRFAVVRTRESYADLVRLDKPGAKPVRVGKPAARAKAGARR